MKVIELKKKQRLYIKEILKNMSASCKTEMSDIIYNKVINNPDYIKADKLFVYISFANEVQTNKIITHAIANGKKVFVPRIKGENMYLVQIDNYTKYSINQYGIKEPLGDIYTGEIDLALIPLVAFDDKLNRLGRGGGYYDKFLQDKQLYKIALAYSKQKLDNIIIESHDIKINMIITDKEVIQ